MEQSCEGSVNLVGVQPVRHIQQVGGVRSLSGSRT